MDNQPYGRRAQQALLRILVGIALLITPITTRASAQDAAGGAEVGQGGMEEQVLVPGEPVWASLTETAPIQTWRLHLDADGPLHVVLANPRADVELLVIATDGSAVQPSTTLGARARLVEIPAAVAGDYLILVHSVSNEGGEDPYLLVATWQPGSAAVAQPSAPPATPGASSPPPPPAPPTTGLNTGPSQAARTMTPEPAPMAPVPPGAMLPPILVPPPVFVAPPPAPVPPPLAPAGLRATPLSWQTIRLDWTNRSDNFTGLYVDGTAGYYPVSGRATTVNIGGLSPSTSYCFHVTAVNAVGEASSNEACATTLDPPPPT